MDEPVYWTALGAAVVALVAVRWQIGRPLLARRSVPLLRWERGAAAISVAALVFHCGAMFFPRWINVIPGAQPAADAVRSLDAASMAAYWASALVLFGAVRRTWWPGPALLAAALTGVGVTMFWPYALSTHLAWLAPAVLVTTGIFVALTVGGPPRRRAVASAAG